MTTPSRYSFARWMGSARLAAILSVLAACAGPADEPSSTIVLDTAAGGAQATEPPQSSGSSGPAQPGGAAADTIPSRLWDREGLEAQPRLSALRASIPPDLGYTPGTTDWRDLSGPLPPGLAAQQGGEHPGELLHRIGDAMDFPTALGRDVWEVTYRIYEESDTLATGLILTWGLQDDSITGRDLRVTMRRSDTGWHAAEVEERFHCSRSVTPEGLCA
jgi:hypothetical protein